MRSFLRPLAGLVFAVLLCHAPGVAQVRLGEFGFQAQSSGQTVGDACWGFTCTPHRLTLPSGSASGLRLVVRAPLGAPWALLASPTGASSCLPFGGIGNALVLDAPWLVAYAGTIDRRNTMRFCYDGWAERLLNVQPLPPGTTIGLQAVAVVGTRQFPSTGPAFSSAIVVSFR